MLNNRVRRIFIFIALLLLMGVTVFIGYGIYLEKERHRIFETMVARKAEAFKSKPNLIKCLALMDYYYWDFHEYEKAFYYADKCIKLNANNTRRGWYVHMVMADIASKKEQMKQACHHIKYAMQLAEYHKIPEDKIKVFKLQKLLNTCSKDSN